MAKRLLTFILAGMALWFLWIVFFGHPGEVLTWLLVGIIAFVVYSVVWGSEQAADKLTG